MSGEWLQRSTPVEEDYRKTLLKKIPDMQVKESKRYY